MPFLGNTPANTFVSIAKQTITGNGGTSYSLSYPVTNANEIDVFFNNVRQEPTVAYSASGTTITFTEAIQSTDSVYVIFNGQAVGTIDAPAGAYLPTTGGTLIGNVNLVKVMTSQYDGIGVRMGSSTANTNRGATYLQHTYIDAGSNQGNYVYNHSLRQTDGTYIANVYTADYSAGVHSWYHPNGGLSGNPVMQIDNSGRVTRPYQPALFAVKNTTITTTGVIANYDTVYFNVGNHFNNGTGTFTCPIAGKYLVTVSSLLSAGSYHIDDQVQKNGSTLSGYWLRSSINGAGEYETNSATMLFDCAVNDTLRYNIAAKTGDLYSDSNGWTRFMVYFLG